MNDLVERAAQLSVLAARWESVRATRAGAIVAIGGEAGAGKTSLVRRFCEAAAGHPRVLSGACDALFTPRPLGPFLDIAGELSGADPALADGSSYEIASLVLAEAAAHGPAILVLEDLHWADEATLDVVWLLARRVETCPLLVLATYRSDEIDRSHPLRVLLGELSGRLARLDVPVLSQAAVDDLARPFAIDGTELYRKTGGNPFFVGEVLAAPELAIPDSVRDAVLARAGRLGDEAHAVLEVVAVAPSHAELWLVEALAPGGTSALEECLDAGIVVGDRDGVAFRHELARVAVRDSIALSRHLDLHRGALEVLSCRVEPDLARLSHHAAAAGDAEAVLRYAPAAGAEAAALGAHREAVAHYAEALRQAVGIEPGVRAALLVLHAWECYLAGNAEGAIESGSEAVEAYRACGDERAEADALVKLSHIQRIEGRIADAEGSIDAALALLEALPPGRELALALATATRAAMANGDAELMHRVGDRALELADRFAVQDVLVDVLISVGTMEMELEGGTDESRVKLERGIKLARDSGLDELAGRAYTTLIYEAFNFCRLDLAERVIGEAISYAASRGLDMRLMCVLGLRAELELSRGDWDGAVEDASSVLGGVRSGLPRLDALVVLGLVRARRGDPDVWGPLDEALAIAKPTDSLWVIFPILAARAEAAWLAGSTETILAESEPFVRRALRAYDRWALPQLAYWRRQAGADEDLSDGDRSPRRLQLGGEAGRAAEEWAALGYPYEAALALADTGDPDDLRRAFAQLQALGATAAAAAVTRRARAGGAQNVPRGPRVSTSGNPAGLTDREVEVVALLAEGLRNAEVAARLFVSEKTVEHHVSAMFRKLGVRTRGQAVAEALRLGIVVSPAV